MKQKAAIAMLVCLGGFLSSCSISSRTMKTSPDYLLLNRTDFELSDQVQAQATTTRVLGIDWNRLFRWESASIGTDLSQTTSQPTGGISAAGNDNGINIVYNVIANLPVIGSVIKGNTASYALSNLMRDTPGYDVILYPQYYRTIKGFPPFYSKTEVNVTARLGKLKN
ncbi:hypothetical protein [Salmonirosea aquatica]|uniref:Uncharacterized protein n=1 Tax=Salmonirosea aquatica TaxID=2654236 RepID=A0A7C9FA94_9BACT|nr:hypothetical protein [Cytophagaceae bacterium SJW1-29]